MQGSGGRRTGIHNSGRQRQQSDTGVPSRRQIPEGIRVLGLNGRGIQGFGGRGSDTHWQHTGERQGEPPTPDLLRQSR